MRDQLNIQNFILIWGKTWKRIISDPKAFFSSLPRGGGTKNPLYFVIPLFLFINLVFIALGQIKIIRISEFIEFNVLLFFLILIVGSVVRALFDVLRLYISAWILDYIIHRFKGKSDFVETFNVVAFAYAPLVFLPIPFIFLLFLNDITAFLTISIIFIAWDTYLTFVGIRIRHEMTSKNALIAVLIPVVISFILFFLLLWFYL